MGSPLALLDDQMRKEGTEYSEDFRQCMSAGSVNALTFFLHLILHSFTQLESKLHAILTQVNGNGHRDPSHNAWVWLSIRDIK